MLEIKQFQMNTCIQFVKTLNLCITCSSEFKFAHFISSINKYWIMNIYIENKALDGIELGKNLKITKNSAQYKFIGSKVQVLFIRRVYKHKNREQLKEQK